MLSLKFSKQHGMIQGLACEWVLKGFRGYKQTPVANRYGCSSAGRTLGLVLKFQRRSRSAKFDKKAINQRVEYVVRRRIAGPMALRADQNSCFDGSNCSGHQYLDGGGLGRRVDFSSCASPVRSTTAIGDQICCEPARHEQSRLTTIVPSAVRIFSLLRLCTEDLCSHLKGSLVAWHTRRSVLVLNCNTVLETPRDEWRSKEDTACSL